MNLVLINHSQVRMPRRFLTNYYQYLMRVLNLEKPFLTIAFLDPVPAKKINEKFRKRSYATDVLSFIGEDGGLGELVICPQVLQRQAGEQGWSFQEELAYMVLHGTLHLLGYDHEKSQREKRVMFTLQDRIFEQWQSRRPVTRRKKIR